MITVKVSITADEGGWVSSHSTTVADDDDTTAFGEAVLRALLMRNVDAALTDWRDRVDTEGAPT